MKELHLSTQKWIAAIILTVAILGLLSVGIAVASDLGIMSSLRIVFGSVYVLFLPGFILSYVFFPRTRRFEEKESRFDVGDREKGAVDWIERVALSFALSIAIVPLVVFYLNLVGVKITMVNSFLTVLGISVISGVFVWLRARGEF